MSRREVITLIGGAASWPLAARAQQAEIPRVGYLVANSEYDEDARARVAAFRGGLEKLGWLDGRNIRIEYRWNANTQGRRDVAIADLLNLTPAAIVAGGTPITQALLGKTRAIPIVFTGVSDPLVTGLVQSLSRPGGNVTGFTNFDFPMGGKWLEILKEVAPSTTRILVLIRPDNDGNLGHFRAIEQAASTLGVQSVVLGSAREIERDVKDFAQQPNGGLIVPPGSGALENRNLIVGLAFRHRLPAIYAYRPYIASGGLMSYDIDASDMYRRAASYVDRILRGEKAGDLPVQGPTKFELVINLKAARALGLTVPLALLARADEVIE